MLLLQLAANEAAIISEEEDVRVRVAATGQTDGASAMLHIRSPDGSVEQGQALKVGETLVVAFHNGRPKEEEEDSFTPYSDWTPDADDDDDDEVVALKDQIHVTLVHVFGEEAVLRFAVPEEWEVAVAIEQPAAKK